MTPLRTSPAIRPGACRAETLSFAQPERVAGRDTFGRRTGARLPGLR
ncbi:MULTISPECIES: hypothetical protein [unclassified Aureimonas]|nr:MULTISPECIES: hypothetical protein [unclassified Aureimonas]